MCLSTRERPEELGVGGPEDRLRPPGAELAQPLEAALRVGDDEVVLPRIGTVVVVEPGVHAAELGQAHRHVSVVEDDRNREARAQGLRDPAQVAHRHREDDDGVDVSLSLEDPRDVPFPARCDEPPDRLPDEPVRHRVRRLLLGPAKERVALRPGDQITAFREHLPLPVARIRLGSPPGRLDCAAPVGGDDQVAAGPMQPFPELPPGRRAPVAEVEIDSRGDGQDLRSTRTHATQYGAAIRGFPSRLQNPDGRPGRASHVMLLSQNCSRDCPWGMARMVAC